MRKVVAVLADIARKYKADLVREDLKDLNLNGRKVSKQLSYRLSTSPYRKLIEYTDHKLYEHGLSILEVDVRRSSTACSIYSHAYPAKRTVLIKRLSDVELRLHIQRPVRHMSKFILSPR